MQTHTPHAHSLPHYLSSTNTAATRAPPYTHYIIPRTCVPVPTNEQKSDLFGGKRKTSPWMYFHPDSSSSMAAVCREVGRQVVVLMGRWLISRWG